MTSYYRLQQKI